MMKKTKKHCGPFARIQIAFYRTFLNRHKAEGSPCEEPAVYLCRHLDMGGVMRSIGLLPAVVRPWCLNIFCDYKSAKKQFKEYTYSVRMKKGRFMTALLSAPSAWWISGMIRSLRGIPVYRGKDADKSIITLKKTVEALLGGDNVLIFPDVEYADTGESTGDTSIYEGFVFLERLYFRRTGKHLPFVPLVLKDKKLSIKPPVLFSDGDFEAQKADVIDKIKSELFDR